MYIPKKKWQFYERQMIKNLLMNDNDEIYYFFGDDKWMKDIYRIACLRRMDSFHVACKYSTTCFQATYIDGEITGEVYRVGDSYHLFDRHYGYNSIGKKYEVEFRNKMEMSNLWKEISQECDKRMKDWGIGKISIEEFRKESPEDETW